MGEDRRLEERTPSFEIVEVGFRDRAGEEWSFPLMVRDRSEGGVGGVYVGPLILDQGITYTIEMPDGSIAAMLLKWVQPLANHVYVLGFQRLVE